MTSHSLVSGTPPVTADLLGLCPATAAALQRIRPDVRAMTAYHVQPAQGMLKLDAMENPFPLPATLQQALGQRLGALPIHRYPGERTHALHTLLASHAGVQIGGAHGQSLMLGNGSDEIISLLALATSTAAAQPAFGGSGSQVLRPVVLAPVPSFVMYPMSARLQGLDFVGVDLLADSFELDVPAMQAAIARHSPALVWLPYPNNPTATLWSEDSMQAVIDAAATAGSIVVVDEAYQPFACRSWLPRMQADPGRNGHVLLMRTLSKFGLAGVRLGYLIGPAALVAEIDKVRPPYNISVLNCEAAIFALEHADLYARQAAILRDERDARLLPALAALPGVERVWPSEANMILLRVRNAAATQAALHAQGVLIKNVHTMHPLLANCLRLTVGTPEENTRLLTALETSL